MEGPYLLLLVSGKIRDAGTHSYADCLSALELVSPCFDSILACSRFCLLSNLRCSLSFGFVYFFRTKGSASAANPPVAIIVIGKSALSFIRLTSMPDFRSFHFSIISPLENQM